MAASLLPLAAQAQADKATINALAGYFDFVDANAGRILPEQIPTEGYRNLYVLAMRDAGQFAKEHIPGAVNQCGSTLPPAGSDVYFIARLWSFYPVLELEKGKTYKLHLTSMDYNHGFSLQPANINIQIVPGFEHVVTVTPNQSGTYSVVCNEFCGIGHHKMVGRLYVK